MTNNLELGKKIIKDKIQLIPKNPGVYRMLNEKKEILYIGKAKNIPRLLISPRREHSRKPDEVYSLIKKLCGGPYLELFSRKAQKGWDSWGKEKNLFNKGIISTRNRPSHMGRKNKRKSFKRI